MKRQLSHKNPNIEYNKNYIRKTGQVSLISKLDRVFTDTDVFKTKDIKDN